MPQITLNASHKGRTSITQRHQEADGHAIHAQTPVRL